MLLFRKLIEYLLEKRSLLLAISLRLSTRKLVHVHQSVIQQLIFTSSPCSWKFLLFYCRLDSLKFSCQLTKRDSNPGRLRGKCEDFLCAVPCHCFRLNYLALDLLPIICHCLTKISFSKFMGKKNHQNQLNPVPSILLRRDLWSNLDWKVRRGFIKED